MNPYNAHTKNELIDILLNFEKEKAADQKQIEELKISCQKCKLERADYDQFFQKSPIAQIIENESKEIIQINQKARELLEIDPINILGQPITDAFKIDNVENMDKIRESFIHSRKMATFTATYKGQSELEKTIELICNPICNEMGKIIYTITQLRDVTKTQESNTLAILKEMAISATANGIIITKNDATIIWVNKAICDMTGYSINDLIGSKPSILKSGQHDLDFYEQMWNAITRGKVWQGVMVNAKKDKSIYYENMTITPIADLKGEITNFIAIKEDITQRMIFEHDLEKSDDLFKTRIQNLQGYIYDIDYEDGVVSSVYHSPQCQGITGYSSDEYYKNPNLWYEMVYEDDKKRVSKFFEDHKSNRGRTSQIDHRIVHKNGDIRWISNTITTVLGDDNMMIREVGFVNDITDRKLAELELRNYRENLEKMVETRTRELAHANRLKSVFLSHISHELRTPLNSILVLSHNMFQKSENQISDKYKKYLGIIERNGQILLKMINEILDLTSIESGKMKMQESSFNIIDLIEATVSRLKPLATQKGLEFHLECEALPIQVTADKDRLDQVLVNLISNAIKYSDSGGIYINCGKDDVSVYISIRDTGRGIREQELENIFTDFYRSPDHKNKIEGTGLGLAIASKIIKLMGGRIEIDSEYGKGSCFTVFIPK